MGKSPTVLKGKTWMGYLFAHKLPMMLEAKGNQAQVDLYSGVTYNHTPIYKIGDYYFTLGIKRGYKNISSLKKLL